MICITASLQVLIKLDMRRSDPSNDVAFSLNDRVTEHVSYWPEYGNKGNIRIKHLFNKSKVWHEGKHDNSRALLFLYPRSADRLGIVLMTNSAHSNLMRISHHLADLLMNNRYKRGD